MSHFLVPSLRSSIRFYNRENFRTMFPLSQAKPILWLRRYQYGYAMHLIFLRFVQYIYIYLYWSTIREETNNEEILRVFP